jgi:Ca2+-binding RTX toxin-like protein
MAIIRGTNSANNINGSIGSDEIYGYGGHDSINGGVGSDTIFGGEGNDTLNGGTGDDRLYGENGNDTFNKILGEGSDLIHGGAGTDTVNYDDNNTTLITLNLHNGVVNRLTQRDSLRYIERVLGTDSSNDVLIASSDTDGVSVNLTSGVVSGTLAGFTYVSGFEHITGGSGGDTLTGNASASNLIGNNGNDSLSGDGGNDTLTGGAGNDSHNGGDGDDNYIFSGAFGVDSISGDNSGTDTINLSAVTNALTITLSGVGTNDVSDGTNTINYSSDYIENVISGSGNDSITGAGIVDNEFTGGAGNDTIDGSSGNDTYKFANGWGVDVITDDGANQSETVDFSSVTANMTVNLNFGASNEATDGANSVNWGVTSTIENVIAGQGNDSITGTGVNNTYSFVNGWGNDTLVDAGGTDKVDFSRVSASVTIWLLPVAGAEVTDGTNTTHWASTIEYAVGGSGNDLIQGLSSNNSLEGGAGNDTINGGGGRDTLIGGAGNDVLNADGLDESFYFYDGWGSDTITTAFGGSIIWADSITSSLTFNLLGGSGPEMTDGTNTVNWSAGMFTNILSGSGNDFVIVGPSGATIYTYGGNDTILGGESNDLLNGGAGNDYIDGGGSIWDTFDIDSGFGHDTLSDSMGWDLLDITSVSENLTVNLTSSTGNEVTDGTNTANWSGNIIDTVTAGIGNDLIYGNSGQNSLNGGFGNDTLFGGDGYDVIRGGGGNDNLDGGESDDAYYFDTNFGADSITDISGRDSLDLSIFNTALTIDLDAGAGNEVSDGTNTINWTGNIIEDAYSGAGNDVINGNDEDNWLDGADGDDSITGGDGNDTLVGGFETDTLDGGSGDDSYQLWGSGADTITDISGTDTVDALYTFGVTINLTSDIVGDEVSDGFYTVNWSGDIIENVAGSSGDDLIYGNSGNNTLQGSYGYDTINGGDGDDIITGGPNESFFFEWNYLNGGSGNDTITGGDMDRDYFVFEDGFGNDSIIDVDGTENVLDLRGLTVAVTANLNIGTGNELTDGINTANWTEDIITEVYGGTNNDLLYSDDSIGKLLDGKAGDDTLIGGSGDDSLYEDNGNDLYQGGEGDDFYDCVFGGPLGFGGVFGDNTIDDAAGAYDWLNLGDMWGGGKVTTDVLSWEAVDGNDADSNVDQLLITFDDGFGSPGATFTILNYFDNSSTLASSSEEGDGCIEFISFFDDEFDFEDVVAAIPIPD